MHVLHVIPGLTHERGGPSVVVKHLAEHQAQLGHEVTVVTTNQGMRAGERMVEVGEGVRVLRLPTWGPDRLAYAPSWKRTLRELLPRTDLVHAHSIFTYPIHATLRVAQAANVPVILRPCGQLHPYSLRRSQWLKSAYLTRWGTMVRCAVRAWHHVSPQEASASWPGTPAPSIMVANGIQAAIFRVDREQARARLANDVPTIGHSPYVLFLGRLHPKKRLDLLVEAFLSAGQLGAKLVVAGPDECHLWPTLAARWQESPAFQNDVVRLPLVEGALKLRLLAAARLFALPSEHENFGIAALEALATGTPVLSSPHVDFAQGRIPEGWVDVAPLEVAAWRERLGSLLAATPPSLGDVEALQEWVQQRHDWSNLATLLCHCYAWVLGGVQGTPPSLTADRPEELPLAAEATCPT